MTCITVTYGPDTLTLTARGHATGSAAACAGVSALLYALEGFATPPLPAAEEGGAQIPQPRHWRAERTPAREWQMRQGGMTPPLPAAEEGGAQIPQPRHWRAERTPAREWQMRQGGMTPPPRAVGDAGPYNACTNPVGDGVLDIPSAAPIARIAKGAADFAPPRAVGDAGPYNACTNPVGDGVLDIPSAAPVARIAPGAADFALPRTAETEAAFDLVVTGLARIAATAPEAVCVRLAETASSRETLNPATSDTGPDPRE